MEFIVKKIAALSAFVSLFSISAFSQNLCINSIPIQFDLNAVQQSTIKKEKILMSGVIPEKWTVKFHNSFHILKEQDNQGQSVHEFDYKIPLCIL